MDSIGAPRETWYAAEKQSEKQSLWHYSSFVISRHAHIRYSLSLALVSRRGFKLCRLEKVYKTENNMLLLSLL